VKKNRKDVLTFLRLEIAEEGSSMLLCVLSQTTVTCYM